MSRVLVGATLPQFSGDREALLTAVRSAEDNGLDSIWLFDHLWPLSGGKQRSVLECWTTLAFLAAATRSIRLGTLVTRSSLRHPALVAKMAATVASIAPGRLIVALGSGDEASRAENEAFGIPYLGGGDRIAQLEATARVFDAFFRADEVSVDTPFVTTRSLPVSPRPDPKPTLWLGGRSDDVLAIAARYAQGWNGWGGTAETFARDARQALAYAGDRPLELSWGGIAVLAADDGAAAQAAARHRGASLVGGPATVARGLGDFIAGGARHLIVTPAGSTAGPAFYGRLAEVASRLPD